MSNYKKLKLLLWKNYLLMKKRPAASIVEVTLPVSVVLILFILRITSVQPQAEKAKIYKPFEIDNPISISMRMSSWKIAISPNTSFTRAIKEKLTLLNEIESVQIFDNENLLVSTLVTDGSSPVLTQSYLCGIVFSNFDNDTNNIEYALRFPANPRTSFLGPLAKWFTNFIFPYTFDGLGPRNPSKAEPMYGGPPPYYADGFLKIQKVVDFSIIEMTNSSFDPAHFKVAMNRYPYPESVKDPFIIILQNTFPLFLMLSLIFTALNMVKDIVIEKERRLKESMKMMGLTGWLHWTAWFIRYFIPLFISISIITILLTVGFNGNNSKMLNHSDGTLVFIFLVTYMLSVIAFCFFISTCFYRASIGAAAIGVLWFLSYFPYFFWINYYNLLPTIAKVLSCLDFQLAMAFGANLIGRFEGQGAGVQWSNLFEGVTVDDTFTFGHILGMLIIDCILYGFFAWYIENVFPGEYGIPKKWYFLFTTTYWCSNKKTGSRKSFGDEEFNLTGFSHFVERDPQNLKVGISIEGLKKEFKSRKGTKVAVDGVNLKFYQGQITSLLGHNGAGKTTTISMLTGLIAPSSGNAIIGGYDIKNNMKAIRESLGICPQHNVLFDSLTVEEHLWFFTCLKGIYDPEEIQKEVDSMIESLGLLDKRHARSKTLSGGMKRKLSVGIALIGDSKVVILDEPTSGMDVAARRSTWDLLLKERKDRTIVLTTHFMDEADVLGDRIAILSKGQIKCCGSSLFLKKKYGVGYHMVMVKEKDCDVKKIEDTLKKYVPTAEVESNIGLELSFALSSDYSNRFEELFAEIEESREELKISSYGASVTTLEEVFMKVKEEEDKEEDTDKEMGSLNGNINLSFHSDEKNGNLEPPQQSATKKYSLNEEKEVNMGFRLFLQRWYAMLVKRIIHSKRHRLSIIAQLLVPAMNLMLALIVVKTMPKTHESPPLSMNLDMFQKGHVPILLHNRTLYFKRINDSFKHSLNQLEKSSMIPQFVKSNMTKHLLEKERVSLAKFNLENLVGLEFEERESHLYTTTWFNNEAIHSPSVAINTLSNTLLNLFSNNKDKRITTINEPLPATMAQSMGDLRLNTVGFQVGFSLCFGMAFLASSFIVFLVQEKSSKAKHVQFVSGVDPISYWTSAYFWDLINFLLPASVIVLLFFVFKVDAFQGERVGYVLLIILAYGWAIIPIMYIFSFLFKVASTAFTRMTMFNILTGLIMLLVIFIFKIPQVNLLEESKLIGKIFLVFPNYNLGQAIVDVFDNYNMQYQYKLALDKCSDSFKLIFPSEMVDKQCKLMIDPYIPHFETNYLALIEPGIGRYLIALAIEGFLYFGIVLLIEYGHFRWIGRFYDRIQRKIMMKKSVSDDSVNHELKQTLDDDVYQEQEKVRNGDYSDNGILVVDKLKKVFKTNQDKITAVNNISLRVPHGECFGLLGQNGAGKTTTFKMLTGDETPTSGCAHIENFDITREMAKVRQKIGYCPQFDALIDLMTGRELLIMYSRLRGVPEQKIKSVVEKLASSLGVEQYIDKYTKTYSGGNKRKLSTAIALAGDQPLIFLDEPSSGMDPAARRNLWDSLSNIIADGKSIVITSHSMEECEALCTRLAIMVNGQFKCLGSPQHLKAKFGDGYTLIAKIGGENRDTSSLKEFIEQSFSGSILKDEHQGYVQYLLTDKSKTWANLFGIMEKAKQTYNIEDYSISQSTLEQIFLNFTRTQRVDDDRD